MQIHETTKGFGGSSEAGDSQSTIVQTRVAGDNVDEERLMQLCKIMEANEPNILPRFQRAEINAFSQPKQDEIMHQMGDVGREFSSVTQSSIGSLTFSKPENNRSALEVKDRHESHLQPSLNMTLGTPSRTSSFVLPFPGGAVDGREQSKISSPSFEPHRTRPILPKPFKSGANESSESNKGVITQMRIARPPGEGRGKSQLLPRYWPRITDQELEKLSGEYPEFIHRFI